MIDNVKYCPYENSFSCEEEKNWSGIYCLVKTDKINPKNNRYYFGSTYRLLERFKEHISGLIKEDHSNRFLKNSFKKHGIEKFKFVILKKFKNITQKELLIEEQIWIDCFWDKQKKCYNIAKVAGAPMTGRKLSKEARQKISKANSGANSSYFGIPKSEEVKKKISISKTGEKNWWYGKFHTEESKKLMSINTSKEKHWFWGGKASEETKRKQSEARTGIKNHNFGKPMPEEQMKKLIDINTKYKFLTKEFLIEEYIIKDKTHTKIALENNCSRPAVSIRCKQYGLKKPRKYPKKKKRI